jgi:hypothetical protein
MTTLATNSSRVLELGDYGDYPVIASDIIYEGAAVGLVAASGHARPLVAGDKFAGFCIAKADNSAGAAAAINARVLQKGKISLSVSGAVITDVGQPVYATDDNAFVFSPVGATYIGKVCRFVSSGVVIVEFDAINGADPYAEKGIAEALAAATKTLDAQDSGKLICCSVTTVVTLPAVEGISGVTLLNIGPFGTVQISADPNANDMIEGADITGADNKDIVNTLATARRGDYITLDYSDTNGWVIRDSKGTWAREA